MDEIFHLTQVVRGRRGLKSNGAERFIGSRTFKSWGSIRLRPNTVERDPKHDSDYPVFQPSFVWMLLRVFWRFRECFEV